MARSYANRHASIDKRRTSTGMRRSTVTAAGGRRTSNPGRGVINNKRGGLPRTLARPTPKKMGPLHQGGRHPGD